MAEMKNVEPAEAVPVDFEIAILTTEFDTDLDVVPSEVGLSLYASEGIYMHEYEWLLVCICM
jgi:hypothetical protein